MADDRFEGVYYGKECHAPDFEKCIARANMFGVKKFLFAAGHIEDAHTSYALSQKSDDFYATIGIHPCRALEPHLKALGEGKHTNADKLSMKKKQQLLGAYFEEIEKILASAEPGKFVAIGECGLDYDRYEYADKASQLMAFEPHF